MKKWIVVGILAATVFGGWYYVSNYVRFTPEYLRPKFAKVSRGDIRVPVSASGLIEPQRRVQVKSKASGEVSAVNIVAGDFVREGEVLVVLDQEQERRNFQRADAELKRAQAVLKQSRHALERAKVNVTSAQASLEELKALGRIRKFDLDKAHELQKSERATAEEVNAAEAQYEMNQANQMAAAAAVRTAELAVEDAQEAVKINEAAVKVAEATFGDAEERLEDTQVQAQSNALVTDVNVEVGEVIQGGAQNITGGTVLAELADISVLKVVAKVDEAEYGRVLSIAPPEAWPEMNPNEAARLKSAEDLAENSGVVTLYVDAFPEETFQGMIDRVEPQGRLSAGSSVIQYDVHVVITDEARRKLLLGSQAQVEFTVDSAIDVLRVPAEAVKSEGERRGVYVRVDPEPESNERWGKRFVPVTFGITDGNYTEIVRVEDGELEEDMQVYTKLPQQPQDD